jgi:hypothetical protein
MENHILGCDSTQSCTNLLKCQETVAVAKYGYKDGQRCSGRCGDIFLQKHW